MLDRSLFRDPNTGDQLSLVADALESPSGARFPIVGGIPILLPSDSLFGWPQEPANRTSALKRLVRTFVPPVTVSIGSAERYERLVKLVTAATDSPRILVIGGGQAGRGIRPLIAAPGLCLVEADVYVGPRTNVVCDAHYLPFADDTFDAVVAQAVLEHVTDPDLVVAEAVRVLKSGGLVYAETPFIQQVHEGAYDFTRFTMSGHRRLFRRFDEIDAGVLSGPATALAWSCRYFLRSLPRRSYRARTFLDLFARVTLCWLPHLDRVLIHRPGAEDGACATYFLGTLRAAPVSDEAIVARYNGGQRRRPR